MLCGVAVTASGAASQPVAPAVQVSMSRDLANEIVRLGLPMAFEVPGPLDDDVDVLGARFCGANETTGRLVALISFDGVPDWRRTADSFALSDATCAPAADHGWRLAEVAPAASASDTLALIHLSIASSQETYGFTVDALSFATDTEVPVLIRDGLASALQPGTMVEYSIEPFEFVAADVPISVLAAPVFAADGVGLALTMSPAAPPVADPAEPISDRSANLAATMPIPFIADLVSRFLVRGPIVFEVVAGVEVAVLDATFEATGDTLAITAELMRNGIRFRLMATLSGSPLEATAIEFSTGNLNCFDVPANQQIDCFVVVLGLPTIRDTLLRKPLHDLVSGLSFTIPFGDAVLDLAGDLTNASFSDGALAFGAAFSVVRRASPAPPK